MNFVNQFKSLNYKQQRDLLAELQQTLSASRPILEHRHLNACPYCNSERLYKHANYKNGGTRFKCVECSKTFNEFTGTSIHRIHNKNQWDAFIRLMLESKTIREISKELKIANQTALNWRHKALSAFNNLYTKQFKGVVETDDAYFRFNQKGSKNPIRFERKLRGISNQLVSVMVTADRYKSIDLTVIKMGKVTTDALKEKLNLNRFNKSNIVYSDKAKAIENLFTDLDIQHETFVASEKYSQSGTVHVQNVNNLTGRLKDWIKSNFNNVSTKYLHNYLNWFIMLEVLKGKKNSEDLMWDYLMKSNEGYNNFQSIADKYRDLIVSE
jgi:transposase-like protein